MAFALTAMTAPSARMPRLETATLGALFTLSGAAALIYQVLWARELRLLFGSTAQAAALTIAIFFTGIALGAGYLRARANGVSCRAVAGGGRWPICWAAWSCARRRC